MEFKSKYQAFNMSYDYNAAVNCPYGCLNKLREEQLLLHVTKCYKKNDELFGHCKYNYLHIFPHEFLSYHEENCPSNIPMTEEDFAYKPEPTNTNMDWILKDDDLSAKYAKYFLFETLPMTKEGSQEEEQSNQESVIENETILSHNCDEDFKKEEISSKNSVYNQDSEVQTSEISEEEAFISQQPYESRCHFIRFIRKIVFVLINLW